VPAKNRYDRCQLHLLYGLFYLGVENPQAASREFARAHAADRSNVFVMMRWARTLYEIGVARHLESDEIYKAYIKDCSSLVRKILQYDPDNKEGISLLQNIRRRFDMDI
ncbi:MAG TPA: hypothetical protein VNW71_25130, partial [Thermoanaerobaculia bacterium]|nr:hypothetical protein [Thermoanaerobaculia bacterium]